MSGTLKLLAAVLIVLQSILVSVLSGITTSSQLLLELKNYLNREAAISIPADIAEESIGSVFLKAASAPGKAVVRKDTVLDQTDGGLRGFKIGFAGDLTSVSGKLGLSFLGTAIFNRDNLKELSRAKPEQTLGIDVSAVDSVAPLPSVRGGTVVVAQQLSGLQATSGTVAGTYYLIGFNEDEVGQLKQQLAQTARTDAAAFDSVNRGGSSDSNLLLTVMPVLVLACWCALTLVLFIWVYVRLNQLGNHLLLGWSRTGYAVKVFRPFILVSFVSPAVGAGVLGWMLEHFSLQSTLYRGITAGAITIPLVLFACLFASLAVYQSKPVAAIRGRIKTSALSLVLACAYLLSVIFLGVGASALDGPMKEIANLSKVRENWQKYDSLEILAEDKPGDNATSFTQGGADHAKEFYGWYSAIAESEGVYLAHTEYYSRSVLREWQQSYSTAPTAPFWHLSASPSYLQLVGFRVGDADVAAARQGTRVIFLPSTLPQEERDRIRGYLQEYDTRSQEGGEQEGTGAQQSEATQGGIINGFSQSRQMRFVEYTPARKLFTWNTDHRLQYEVAAPVITLLTPQNMIPLESESLYATGLANSYIKLTPQAAKRYLAPAFLAEYHLDDNSPKFLPVSEYVAGLHKQLGDTIALFGSVLALLAALQLLLVAALVQLFGMSRRELVAATRLLGQPLLRVFLRPLMWVGGCSLVAAVVLLAARSMSGAVMQLLLGAAAVVLLLVQASVVSRRLLAKQIKSS